MALVWIDGFDGYGPATTEVIASQIIQRRYPETRGFSASSNQAHVVAGRELGTAIQLTEYLTWIKTPRLTEAGTLIAGCALKRGHIDQCRVFTFHDSDGNFILLYSPNGSTELAVYLGATHLGTTTGANLVVGAWKYIEFKVVWGSTTGYFEVKVDGVTVLSDSTQATGVAGGSYYNAVQLSSSLRYGGPASPSPQFDDFYICDSTGSINNDFLGDRKVVTLFPTEDVETTFPVVEPSGDHFSALANNPPDESISYIEGNAVDQRDLFELQNLPANLGQPDGIQVVTTGRSTEMTWYTLAALLSLGGSDYTSPTAVLGQGPISTNWLLEKNPATGDLWTLSELETLKAGLKVG